MSSPDSPAVKGDGESLLLKDQKISPEDRKEILETIDKIVSENKIAVTPDQFSLKPKRNGLVFPLVINGAAVVAVVAGFFIASAVFNRQQNTISGQAGTFFSAEGKLLDAVRKQSEAQLAAKDQQIAQAQSALTKLGEDAANLRKNMDSTIAAKEAELQGEMQSQLAAEKARLEKLGISEDEVNRRLRAYQESIEQQYDQQLAAYRSQSETELDAKEAEIRRQEAQSQAVLAQANAQRQQIVNQAQTREVQMRAQFESERQQLQAQAQVQASQAQAKVNQAQAQLAALASQTQSEQLLSDQVVGSYTTILQDIQQSKFDQALTDMNALRTLLSSPKIDTMPELAKRRTVDLAVLSSLATLIKARNQSGGAPLPALDPAVAQAANQLIASEALVAKGDDAQAKGDAKGAKDFYTQALTRIPAIDKAFTALQGSDADATKRLLAERDAIIQGLKADAAKNGLALAASQASVLALQQKIASQGEEIDQIGKSAGTPGADLTVLQTKIDDQNQLISELKDQLGAAQSRSTDLEDQLADNQAKLESAQTAVSAAQSERNENMYGPDDLKSAEVKAREAALDDVLLLTNYFAGANGSQAPELAQKIQALSNEDALYRTAITGIESLALNGTHAKAVVPPPKLVGSISFIDSNTATVEKFVNIDVPQGATVLFKHKDGSGTEIPIAEGTVSSVSADSFDVTIKSSIDGAAPPSMLDLAYLEAPSGS